MTQRESSQSEDELIELAEYLKNVSEALPCDGSVTAAFL